jgi:hypothetical protein
MTPSNSFEQRNLKHIGVWVDDVPKAVDHWTRVYGAGPFFDVSSPAPDGRFRGEPVRFREEAAYGRLGVVSIVLSRFIFEPAVPELQALLHLDSSHPTRMAFLAYRADDAAADSARLEALGYPMFFSMGNGPISTYWHDSWEALGHCVEVTADVAVSRRFQSAVDRAAEGWDGTRALRSELPAELESHLGRHERCDS